MSEPNDCSFSLLIYSHLIFIFTCFLQPNTNSSNTHNDNKKPGVLKPHYRIHDASSLDLTLICLVTSKLLKSLCCPILLPPNSQSMNSLISNNLPWLQLFLSTRLLSSFHTRLPIRQISDLSRFTLSAHACEFTSIVCEQIFLACSDKTIVLFGA